MQLPHENQVGVLATLRVDRVKVLQMPRKPSRGFSNFACVIELRPEKCCTYHTLLLLLLVLVLVLVVVVVVVATTVVVVVAATVVVVVVQDPQKVFHKPVYDRKSHFGGSRNYCVPISNDVLAGFSMFSQVRFPHEFALLSGPFSLLPQQKQSR